MYINQYVKKHADCLYAFSRIVVGLLFLSHGAQKLFGALGGTAVDLFSLIGLAGVVEFFGGLLLVLGVFVRLAALASAIIMAGAYITAHASKAMLPIANGGELALMYFCAMLIFLAYGAKKWSLEQNYFKKEHF